ncbi:MAG: 2-succinyl-5-enolpyruvyl-6-hydroxy-3-cyclohexene-1-carboxylic-acid synthase [Crocinitomicaceae bacterium]|nr:2-succinyl-5-enolpyruvyl-6-hydroxy-3-cyclohexene-1-carboxylic-acid synthase [Crocinitomicaceae bacterium]
MRTTDKTGVAIFIDQCVQHGMRHVVCSPGSRNAPLVIAIDEHPLISTIVIHDERVAAFYALGMAQQLNAPVGVVCTSGSAMLNYYPAVAEAYYQCVPLVVMTADRPEEWIDHGDGQTIVQKGVYTNHCRFQGAIEEFASSASEIEKLTSLVAEAFDLGSGNWKGPMHFNVPVSEPLYASIERSSFPEKEEASSDLAGHNFSNEEVKELSSTWSSSKRKMILCGQITQGEVLLDLLTEMGNDTSVVVMVENTSNLVHSSFIHCIDRTLSSINDDEIEAFKPEILITIGGAIISKRIKKFLRDSSRTVHWRVGFEFPEMDTYRALSKSFECSPATFFKALLPTLNDRNNSMFGAKWKQKDFFMRDQVKPFMQTVPYSDLQVFETILDYIPEGSVLHMGNSSVVRYCQLFDPVKSILHQSNRGTSGIDGCTSTACGAALADPNRCHVLITGDVSFFYDSNALWSNHLPSNLRIVLVNNSGGGIFRIIDGPESTGQLEKYFEAQHDFSAEHICKAFNVGYVLAQSNEEIEGEMEQFYTENERPKLIEIMTPSTINAKVLKEFFQQAKMS